jgi:hypothetical protein
VQAVASGDRPVSATAAVELLPYTVIEDGASQGSDDRPPQRVVSEEEDLSSTSHELLRGSPSSTNAAVISRVNTHTEQEGEKLVLSKDIVNEASNRMAQAVANSVMPQRPISSPKPSSSENPRRMNKLHFSSAKTDSAAPVVVSSAMSRFVNAKSHGAKPPLLKVPLSPRTHGMMFSAATDTQKEASSKKEKNTTRQ